MPSTTDVIQVATGVASLAVSALALREARLQRVGRDGSGPPPPEPAPHLPVGTATALPLEPPPDVPPVTGPLPRPAPASSPPGPAPATSPPGPPGEAEPPAPSPPPQGAAPPPAWGPYGYPDPPPGGGAQMGPGALGRPPASHVRGWLPWAAVVGAAAVLVVLGGVALFARADGPAASGGPAREASQVWVLVSMALLVLTVVIALVVRGRRPPSRVVWAAVPAVLAAASVAVIVYALPVPAAVKLGAVVAALGVAARSAFRR